MNLLVARLRAVLFSLALLALVVGLIGPFFIVTVPTPSPPPARTAPPPPTTPPRSPIADLAGTWLGTFTQPDVKPQRITLTITGTPTEAAIDTPSLACGGHLFFEKQLGNVYLFREKIEYGVDRCANDSLVRLTVNGNAAAADWYYSEKGPSAAQFAGRSAFCRNCTSPPPPPPLPAEATAEPPARPRDRTINSPEEDDKPPPPRRDDESYQDYFDRIRRH